MASYSTIAPEFEAMTQSAIANIRKLTDEQLERFGELMIRKGTPSAGIRGYGYSDILKGSAEREAAERAKYGVAGLQFGEQKRQFGETAAGVESRFGRELGARESQFGRTLGETQRQFDVGTKLKERELSLFEQQLADLKGARRKEAKNWWKKYLGQAAGIGLGLALPGIGTALGGGISSLFSSSSSSGLPLQGKLSLFGEWNK